MFNKVNELYIDCLGELMIQDIFNEPQERFNSLSECLQNEPLDFSEISLIENSTNED